ncbi:hypothetical protein RHOSPDRAFT_33053 [Rhodotorula sp. JG-1b]|nr:hypothetical protein RHOSPDRAFT_33053 [Rhodotorula sp. JG-1b]
MPAANATEVQPDRSTIAASTDSSFVAGEAHRLEQIPARPRYDSLGPQYLPFDGERVPVEFVRDVLHNLLEELLLAVRETTVLRCRGEHVREVLPPPDLPVPTHVFIISFDDSEEIEEIPTQGLVWAATGSGMFAPLLEPPDDDILELETTAPFIMLPTSPLRVPYKSAWAPLHDFVYLGSTSRLLETLGHRSCGPISNGSDPQGQQEEAERALLRIRALWSNVAALRLGDEKLWDAIEDAWARLLRQQQSREGGRA